jgi:hypothetical protein
MSRLKGTSRLVRVPAGGAVPFLGHMFARLLFRSLFVYSKVIKETLRVFLSINGRFTERYFYRLLSG